MTVRGPGARHHIPGRGRVALHSEGRPASDALPGNDGRTVWDQLSLDITTTLGAITVSASGEIDLATVDHLKDTLTGLWFDGATIRLDLRDVTFIDSTGINALVVMDRRSKERGCRLVLSAPSPAVQLALDYTGAETVLNLDDQAAG